MKLGRKKGRNSEEKKKKESVLYTSRRWEKARSYVSTRGKRDNKHLKTEKVPH